MTNINSIQHQQVTDLFANIWQNYIEVTPSADKIQPYLEMQSFEYNVIKLVNKALFI
jgi:hypothetical protein